MATYPNNYRAGVGFNPNYTYFGAMPYFVYNAELGTGAGSRLNWQIGTDGGGFARTASCPDGYGMNTPFPPVKAGGISGWSKPVAQVSMTCNLLNGGAMQGAGSMELSAPDGNLSMIVSMSGTSAVATLTGSNMVLRLTVGLSGNGSFQITGTNNLALIVPFEGAGSVVTMGVGATDLRGLLSMDGEWTPFTELSPEGLANAVWGSLVDQYQGDGTMGKALGTASTGGVDLGLMASAVWSHSVEGLTAEEILRVMLAALAGKRQGLGTGTELYMAQDGVTPRITLAPDQYGNGEPEINGAS
jgi:hypothetical protein